MERATLVKSFPFGMPVAPLRQQGDGPRRVFVLGVYASAVHARWVRADGSTAITARAVASEPEIFWRGDGADEIVSRIPVPAGAGKLVPAGASLNGPSGHALDKCFLEPLGIDRSQAWLCDLLPESRCNPKQAAALESEYRPVMAELGLPEYDFPAVPTVLADESRVRQIEAELAEAQPQVLVTLGDQPLKWFTKAYGSESNLSAYGEDNDSYGRLHDIEIAGRKLSLLPLVHPRQAGRLGSHSGKWFDLHDHWMRDVAPGVLERIPVWQAESSIG